MIIALISIVILGILLWKLKITKQTNKWIDAAYTKPNLHQYAGYWQWPKSPKI